MSLVDLVDRAARCAAAFRGLGVQPGDTVAVQVPSRIEGVIAQAAAVLAGAVLVPVVPIYGPRELGFILRESRARLLVTPDRWGRRDYLADLHRLGGCPDLSSVAVIADSVPQQGYIDFRQLVNGSEPLTTPTAAAPDDVCLLVYTSGTTGQPKGVQHTHTTLLAELRTRLTGDATDSVILAAFPSGHVAGTLGLLRMLLQGVPHVVMDTWDATKAARLINEHGVTATGGTPFFLTTLLDLADEVDLSCLREYAVGGASVPPNVIERAHQHGITAFRAYGSSEHPTISGGSSEDTLDQRAHTDGRLLDGVEVRIVSDALQNLPAGTPGEILSRGPELFIGYRDSALDADAFLPGGWFRTGDIGVLDPDGLPHDHRPPKRPHHPRRGEPVLEVDRGHPCRARGGGRSLGRGSTGSSLRRTGMRLRCAAARSRVVAHRRPCAFLRRGHRTAPDTRTPRDRRRPTSHGHRQGAQGRTPKTPAALIAPSADAATS